MHRKTNLLPTLTCKELLLGERFLKSQKSQDPMRLRHEEEEEEEEEREEEVVVETDERRDGEGV